MFKDENRHYSLRKLSVGLASVLIGISFASSMNGNSVKADTVKSDSNGAQTVVKGSAVATKIDAKDDANAIESNTESAPEASKKDTNVSAQDIKQKAMKTTEDVTKLQAAEKATKGNAPEAAAKNITDSGQAAESTLKGANLVTKQQNTAVKGSVAADKDDSNIKNDSLTAKNSALKATVETAKQGLETPVLQHSDRNETALNAKGSKAVAEGMIKEGKTEVKKSLYDADLAKSKLKMATLLTIAGKKLNAQMLSESKIMSPAKDTSLPVLNTNDAYALDEKNGLHEHANVNDNGGYDSDFWGKIDLNNWNYTQDNAGDITLSGYKGSDNTKIIIPNIADFAHGNVTQTITLQVNPNVDTNKVYISSSVMHDLAKNATRIGLSKTANKKVVAKDSIWQDAFGGLTNGPSGNNSDGGINVLNPNLTVMDLHNLDTSNITNMSAMFNGGTNLETIGDLSNWDTGHVTDMSSMFNQASSLINIGDLSNWDTSKVTNMQAMFSQASNLTNIGNLSKWNTGKVTDMNAMFQLASSLTNIGDLSNWNTSNVTDMNRMFAKTSNLTNIGDLSKWDTSKVTNMQAMFQLASSLTNIGNLNNWNTSNVTDMSWMFNQASSLINIGDLSNWDTSKVTNMQAMFSQASNLTNIGNLSKWNTGKVTDMNAMFQLASSLTNIGDLSNWNTSNVTDMNRMFAKTSNLTNIGDLSKWDTSKVTNMQAMFQLASSLTNIGNLDNWKTANVTDMSSMFSEASNLTNIGDLSKWDTSNVTDMSYMFNQASNLTNIGNLSGWDTSKVTNMSTMFQSASSLTNIGNLDNWNTGNVTDISFMFNQASNLTNIGDLSNWDTGKVTDMQGMFQLASSLTNIGDLSNWNTSNVTDMNRMFAKTSNLTNIGDLSKWDTSKVTNMEAMFGEASNLTNIGNLDNWDTGNVTDISFMFNQASNLTNIGNLSKWDTSKVTDMHFMFNHASKLANIGDLSGWDTSNVTNMKDMFGETFSLTNIGDLSKWDTSNITDMSFMFISAKSLHNLNISNWNLAKLTDKEALKYIFANDVNLTVIANNITLPTWYDNELNDSDYFWNNHMAVITNNDKLLKATGDTDTLTIDNTQAARSIFYDSKGSSDAIKVLTDANNQYIADYHKANPTKVLKLADTVDQNDPIALANASFVTVTYKLVASNTNDAFALDSKHGLHEHANVNDNGGYDADFWGKINVDNWNYTVNGDIISISGLKDGISTGANDAVIVPNLYDFKLAGKDGGAKTVYISKDALGINSKHKYYGLSKTNGNTFATDSDLSLVFYKNSKLTHADLNSLNTSNATDMTYMFSNAKSLTDLDVSNWNTSNVTTMTAMFIGASSLTNLDVSKWNTSNVTNMGRMFTNASSLTNLDVSHWDTSKVTDMHAMFYNANSLTSLDVSHWDTSKVTNMRYMFDGARSLTNLNVSDWDTSKVTNMRDMFNGAGSLALIVNGDKFADYLVKNNFADSRINSGVKSVTTDNTKLLQLLTNDSQHDSATRTIVLTFPAGYSPDLTKYHLTKTGNTYQIKQSIDYDKLYLQGTVLINATDDLTEHHIDTTKPNKLSDTWQPNYDKLVLAHKNSDGSVSFDAIQLPKVPGYKARINNPNMMLFSVSFMALPKPVTPVQNDAKPAKTVTPAIPVAIEVAKPIKTEPKIATTPKTINLSNNAVSIAPKEATWQVANNLEHDTYHVSNGKYTVELPHISNAQLHVIANDSTKNSVLFTYKGQNTKYVFNIKFVNGHYLLSTYEIKSGKLVKLIDYNFIKSSKMIDTILDWLKR